MGFHAPLDWVLLDPSRQDQVKVGDRVSADAGGMPIFTVVGFEDDKVLLDDERHTAVRALPLAAFRWKAEHRV